jgi:hypothetical protein
MNKKATRVNKCFRLDPGAVKLLTTASELTGYSEAKILDECVFEAVKNVVEKLVSGQNNNLVAEMLNELHCIPGVRKIQQGSPEETSKSP